MWRRRPLSSVPARISRTLTRRRALRLAVFGVLGALTLMWLHGSLAASVRATSAATAPGVVQNVEAHLTSADTQIKVSPKVATTPGDVLAGIVEVRRTSGLTMVTSVTDSAGDSWVRGASVHNHNLDEELWYARDVASIAHTQSITITTALAAAIAVTVVEVSDIATTAPLDVAATSMGISAHAAVGPTAVTVNASEVAIAGVGWAGVATAKGQTAGYTVLPGKPVHRRG